jgi:hypothetical protein
MFFNFKMISGQKKKFIKIPKKVFDGMKEQGALVDKLVGENLYSVTNLVYGDKAWKVYEDWGVTVDADPQVLAVFTPPENIIDSVLCPDEALCFPIQREANSIVYHYAPLRMEDFRLEALPEVGPPLRAVEPFVRVHHTSIALTKIMSRIQRPPENYLTLQSLRTESYMCTIIQQWSNAGVAIHLFKA